MAYAAGVDVGSTQTKAVIIGEDRRIAARSLMETGANVVRAAEQATVAELIENAVPTVSPETELPEVARLMADFNLLAIPVIDGDDKPIGVVAVDDVIELLLPEGWRRRAGLARG